MDYDYTIFQVALNRDLTQDESRRKKAMKVLSTMLSEDAQNQIISDGQDLLSYSQDVALKLTEIYERCETCDRRKPHVYPHCVK